MIGNNIVLAGVGDTVADPTMLTVTGAGDVTLGAVSVGAAGVSADSDMDGAGTLTISAGETFSVAGGDHNLTAAKLKIHPNSLRRLIRVLGLRDSL